MVVQIKSAVAAVCGAKGKTLSLALVSQAFFDETSRPCASGRLREAVSWRSRDVTESAMAPADRRER